MDHAAATAKKTFSGSLKRAQINKSEHDAVFALSTMRGRRQFQEDAFIIQTELRACDSTRNDSLPGHALFAVFDGHGTSFASDYASENFVSTFCSQASFVEYSKQFADESNQFYGTVKKNKGKSLKNNPGKKCSLVDGSIGLLEDAIKTTMLSLDAKLLMGMNSKNQHTSTLGNESDSRFDVSDAGTTAIIVMLTPNCIICANLGDSRAILQRNIKDGVETTIKLSSDHKPINECEEARILKAGGTILGGKIEARLAVSRGLGDFTFKHSPSVTKAADVLSHDDSTSISEGYVKPEDQIVSSVPEIITLPREHFNDKFLVLCSDGIWDVLSNEKCAYLITTIFQEGEQSVALACEELLDQCYLKGSLDNMTAILITFPSQEIGSGGGVMKRRKQRKSKGHS